MTNCTLNQIFLGEIASVQNYGAFVKIPGCPQQGLVHKSQVSSARVDDVADVLQRGERVWCKVISIDDQGKIGLSMKYVNQGNGKDLDPNSVELQRDLQKKKQIPKYEKKVIHLQAVLNTTCTKCGTHGHLAKDCFMTPDGKKYELLSEHDDNEEQEAKIVKEEESTEKKNKRKKSKKKKSKKKKKDSDGSDTDDSNECDKRKKKKKRNSKSKRRSNSQNDDSSSELEQKHQKRKYSKDDKTNVKKIKYS